MSDARVVLIAIAGIAALALVPIVAPPVGLLSWTLKVSLPSSTASSWVASRIVREIWPGAKVAVPDRGK